MITDTIPPSIKSHRYGGVLGRIWEEVHRQDGIVTIVFCGKRGKGKTLAMIDWAMRLDRTSEDIARFRPENIRYDPVDFFKDLTGDYPTGKVLCLDDAGLHMYKSDALSDLLKRISKILQNIRYKHPIILMSLPYFGQLMKDARDMSDLYIEMEKVDRDAKLSYGKLQSLKIAPFTGELYRMPVMQSDKVIHPRYHISYNHWDPKQFSFDKPPKEFIKAYEAIKTPAMNKINAEHLRVIKEKRDKAIGKPRPKKFSFPEAVKYCEDRLPKFLDKKKRINITKIMMEVDENGCQLFNQSLAKLIIRQLRWQPRLAVMRKAYK